MLNRLRGIDVRNADPAFDPNAPEAEAPAVGDQAADTIATRPEYYPALPRTPLDPSGFLSDILKVLLGTYNDKGRPEQLNISPGFSGEVPLHTHVRYHITHIKGSSAVGSQRIDIKIGSEIIESIYAVGGPFDYAASFWVDRGQSIQAIGLNPDIAFSLILIAVQAD